MKNVLFLHSSAEMYGSDRSLLNIVKFLDKKQYSITVVLPCNGPLVNEINNIEGIQVRVFNIAILRRKDLSLKGLVRYCESFKKSCKYLKSIIYSENIDIVYTNTAVVFPGAIVAKKLKKKSVWHIREIIKNKYENMFVSYIVNKYSDVIVANSKATGEAITNNKNKLKIVYNGVAEQKYEKKITRTNENITIGMAGRINRWKGQKLFVDMAARVYKKCPSSHFLIAGDTYKGEEYLKNDLIKYIQEKGLSSVVELTGRINNMNQFYQSLDIFVLPSIQPEPFGLVVIEAMEFGIPVIATNQGGPTEIIKDGVTGYLVSYSDCDEMTNRCISLINDSNKRYIIGNAGMIEKRNLFSINKMGQDIQNILDCL